MKRILLVEDKRGMRTMLTAALEEDGWNVTAASDGTAALGLAADSRYDAVLTDVCLPGADGLEVLEAVTRSAPGTPVVLMTAFGTIEMAVSAMKRGARDFVTKPFDLSRLLGMLSECLCTGSGAMVGGSGRLAEALERAGKAASSTLNVLILGESGTGKELLARHIHNTGDRGRGPFIPVNCAAIPAELMESELFGAERGAFTGADARRPGRFEMADGGTVFLDEVGDLAPGLQGKLLRVLQDREFLRVGGTGPVRVDVRILSASNRDLEQEVARGRFRADLYYRISEFPVTLPALRDRREDIPALAAHFLAECGHPGSMISDGAMRMLEACDWPGNVRELRSIVIRAAALSGGGVIEPSHLEIRLDDDVLSKPDGMLSASGRAARETERRLLVEALESCGGNRTEAARRLGVSRRTLLNRIREFGL